MDVGSSVHSGVMQMSHCQITRSMGFVRRVWIIKPNPNPKRRNKWPNKQEAFENIGPIRHCKPPHAHSPGVATVATVARRLRIDVHDNANDDMTTTTRDRGDRYGPIEWTQ